MVDKDKLNQKLRESAIAKLVKLGLTEAELRALGLKSNG